MSLRLLLAGILFACFTAVCALQAVAPINFEPHGFAIYMLTTLAATAFLVGAGLLARYKLSNGASVSDTVFGCAFLFEFAVLATPLNHFALWVHGPYIDGQLAMIDRAIGFDWPALMAWFAAHPALNAILWWTYALSGFQVLLACIALTGNARAIERLCLATAISSATAIGFWAAFPSFGAVAVYGAPDHMRLVMDNAYTRGLLDLLSRGPRAVSLVTTKGVVGFPSYHAVESVLACWYLRGSRGIFFAFCAFNAFAFVSMPVQGGRHLVDLFGGVAVAAIAIAATGAIASPMRSVRHAIA